MLWCKLFGHKYEKKGLNQRCLRCNTPLGTVIDMAKFADALVKNDKLLNELRHNIAALAKRLGQVEKAIASINHSLGSVTTDNQREHEQVAATIDKLKRAYNQMVEYMSQSLL